MQTQQLKDATEAAKQTTVDDLTRGIVNYKYLGLDFEKADNDRLRYVPNFGNYFCLWLICT